MCAPEKDECLSAADLLGMALGGSWIRYGPFGRSANIGLQCWRPGAVATSANFEMKCRGMFNSEEWVMLRFAKRKITFQRGNYSGKWFIDGVEVGDTRVGFSRRWFYFGHNVTRMRDGTILDIRMPFFGPSVPVLFDCYCTAILGEGCRIRMYLARRSGQRCIFEKAQAQKIGVLSEESRAVLLGEFCRVYANYSHS